MTKSARSLKVLSLDFSTRDKYAQHNIIPAEAVEKTEMCLYIEYLIRRDVMRYLPGIRNLANKALGRTSLAGTCVEIDYQQFPIVLSVCKLQSTWTYDNKTHRIADYRRLMARARLERDDVVFVIAKVVPSVQAHPMTVLVPFHLLDDFIVPEAERPSLPPAEHTRTNAVDSQGNTIATIPFDKVDQYLAERQYKFGPWEGELYPINKLVRKREVFKIPPMPEEYPSSDEDTGDKRMTGRPSDCLLQPGKYSCETEGSEPTIIGINKAWPKLVSAEV